MPESLPWVALTLMALVQGITEFLPVSSSGHLLIFWEILSAWGNALQGATAAERLALDIAAHVGSLLAVLVYMRRPLAKLTWALRPGAPGKQARNLLLMLAVATMPLVVAGALGQELVTELLRRPKIMAWATIVFALLLWVADRPRRRLPPRDVQEHHMIPLKGSPLQLIGRGLFIGCMQSFALIPGASRSGLVITAARLCGYSRAGALELAFMLSIPAIAGASLLAGWELTRAPHAEYTAAALILVLLSFAVALMTLHLLGHMITRMSFTPFVIYRIAFGLLLLAWL